MTPFGEKLRALRKARGMRLKDLAEALQVSTPYLSALEHGRRGTPGPGLIHQVNEVFGLIWDEAEEMVRLARVSEPKVAIDTAGLDPEATRVANRLARAFRALPPEAVAEIAGVLDRHALPARPRPAQVAHGDGRRGRRARH